MSPSTAGTSIAAAVRNLPRSAPAPGERGRRLPRAVLRLLPALALTGVAALAAADEALDVPTPATDPVLARNLAIMQEQQPGVLDIDWRQPTELLAGARAPAMPAVTGRFPAPDALARAREYSEELDGYGMLVWHRGELVDAYFDDGITASTPFAAYSMHKSVLALAVLAAVEDGILGSLDDAVGTYIPEWADDARGAITLRQLLQQLSGLAHYPFTSNDPRAAALSLSSRVSDTALTYARDKEPGTEFNYSNVNSQVVGIALENQLAKRGLRYAEYLSERLWKPLGNGDARLWLESREGSPRFYAGLAAGLADWLRVGVMLLNEGQVAGEQLLAPGSIAQLTTPGTLNASYGLNTWLGGDWHAVRRYGPKTPSGVPHAEPYLAPGVIFFDGFGGQRVYVVPSEELVVARFGEVRMDYDDSVIVNTLLRGLMAARQAKGREEYQSESAHAVYMQRFARLLEEARGGRGLAGYDPLAPLPGAAEVVPLPRGEAAWLDAETQAWLDEFGATTNTQALIVWHAGEVVYEDYPGGRTPQDLVVSRSLSKPISVVAVGRAIEEGFIPSLDEPIATYLTEWQGSDKARITIRHLLQMRSGLAPQGNSMEAEDVMNRAYLHPYHIEVILAEYPLVTEPGSRYDYSNANGELVAPIIERATGRRYEQWLGEAVLAPLDAAGGEIWVNRAGGTPHSGCCALLPPESYLKLAVLYDNDGVWNGQRLLPEGYVEQVRTPTETNVHAGMGVYVAGPYVEGRGAANPDFPYGKTPHGEPYLDRDLYLFDGNSNQVVYIVPRHDLIVLRVGVRPPKEKPWDNSALPNFLLRQLSAATGAELVPQPGPQ